MLTGIQSAQTPRQDDFENLETCGQIGKIGTKPRTTKRIDAFIAPLSSFRDLGPTPPSALPIVDD